MPFVTVVSMGASAASEFIANAISSKDSIFSGTGKSTSTLTGIRTLCENDLFEEETNFYRKGSVMSGGVGPIVEGSQSARRKSVSFLDLTAAPPASESGYSSGSSSSTSSTGTVGEIPGWCESNEGRAGTQLSRGSVQAKTTVWKSWLKNKLHLPGYGKYNLEGSLGSLTHFGIKVNKSLLVECTPDTEYSTKKFYTLKKFQDASNGQAQIQAEDVLDGDDNCNLFVRECLKTYGTPNLELVEDASSSPSGDVVDSAVDKTSSSPLPSQESQLQYKAPDWFWASWSSNQHRGIPLDEAGICLEGYAIIIHKEENLGDRFVQVKWDGVEERFWFIVWTTEAGREFIRKIDLGEVEPTWHGDHKMTLEEGLILHASEQRRGLLRELYSLCCEIGCFERSAGLASKENVERISDVVRMFQRVTAELSINAKRVDTKSPAKSRGPPPSSFTLRLDSLDFKVRTESGGAIEPYYVSMSLFDVKNGRKISEDFHTWTNMHGKFATNPKALFRVSEVNDQIYVVVRVEKTLHALDADVYLRGNPEGKTGSRISKNVTTSPLFTESQRYRMPLCWAARSLFCKSSSTTSGSETTDYILDAEATFTSFYKYDKCSDDELLKLLVDIKKPEKTAKLTLVPGSLRSCLEVVKSFGKDESYPPAEPVVEFPSKSMETFTSFSHLLYVYPISFNLGSTVVGKIRARNIVCRVFLRAEDDVEASPLDFPESGAIATYVLHHRTNPEWYSEIKLSLPVALDPRLHLLFQFSHISCSFDKAPKAKQVENIVGYAWIPLLNKFRFIGGEHLLPVAASLPTGYLQIQPLGLGRGSQIEDEVALERPVAGGVLPQLRLLRTSSHKRLLKAKQYSGPDIGWLDKCAVAIKLNLVSTVWTKCGCLGAFFAHSEKLLQKGNNSVSNARFHLCDDENTVKAIKTLESIDLPTLRDFFPTIINQICSVATMSKPIASASFKFLIFAFHSMIENGLEFIVAEYTTRQFLSTEEAGTNKQQSPDVLIDSWIDVFETGDGTTIALSLEHSAHLFSMITKSFGIHGFKCPNPEESKLVKLIQLFTSEVVQRCQPDLALSRTANGNLLTFFRTALFVITQRHIVFAAINTYLACFGPGDSHKVQDFKFSLLQSLVENPLFLELNSVKNDEEFTRLDNVSWAKRHFLVATVMKQSRSGLGEVSNVRSLALKPIMTGLALHEEHGTNNQMWIPWLRVVCDNLHRVSTASLSAAHSSRCSSVSTILSATAGTLVQAALSKSLAGSGNSSSISSNGPPSESENASRKSSLSVRSHRQNGMSSSATNCSMSSISSISMGGDSICRGTSDRMSLDRLSLSNCDYLDAISAIKMSHPAAATTAPASVVSVGSGTETIVNETASMNGSGDGESSLKEPSETNGEIELKVPTNGESKDGDKSNVVLRRYDKLNDVETSQLLVSGLYVLKTMGKDGLRVYWSRSSSQERASLLQMIHLACAHFTNAQKNSTITRKKVVGIIIPPTQPPSPRTSLLPNKKWSSLPLKGSEDVSEIDKKLKPAPRSGASDWKHLSTEATFVCIDTLANLSIACKGENNEMRDVIRTTLDVAKASEDTRAILGALENLSRIEDLATIVFAKGNEDLSHQLFCDLLNGFGTSYLINTCVGILGKLYMFNPQRATSQSLVAVSSLTLNPVFIHNFRKALSLLERGMSINDRSSFVTAIAEKLSFIDVQEFEPKKFGMNTLKVKQSSFRHLTGSGIRRTHKKLLPLSPNGLPMRLATILNSLWVLKSCQNDYRVSELYLKLANSYSHFARSRLRFDVFDSLKDEHLARKRYSEALLCELHVAAGLGRQSATPEVRNIMLGISLNLKYEFEEIENVPVEEDTTEELIQRLENCVHLCEKAERYELMLEVFRILTDIQESMSDYAALEHSFKQMSRACALIQNKRERFLATYYRVALHHPSKAGLRRSVEVFVYKEPNVTSLMEICNKVETAESAVIVSGDIDQVPDDDKLYATITHLTPIPSESPRPKLWSEDFRRHQNVHKFSYDTPFTIKSQDKINVDNKAAVHQQWKRRTTIQTEFTFPAVVSRLRVVSSEEEDLSPIIVAIDDMQRRVTELRSEVNSMDLKRIQLRLQGSVSVQVNQGPLAYARAFLEKENEFPPEDMIRLKNIFRDFVECCGELLIRNGHLIPPEQADYQAQLETDYTRLCQVLSTVLGLPEIALNRMSRISVSSY